jgi:DUF4097 and DUF4098 domain-containing protein YvlB
MASGTPTPPPTPRPRRRSFAAPAVLILIGVLFLVRNLGYPIPLLRWFALYWPLLIILWGVLKAVEYWQAHREGAPAPGIGPGGILLLVFLILCGVTARKAMDVNWAGVRDNIDMGSDFPMLFGNSYEFVEEQQQAFPPGSTLSVVSDRGDVTVQTWDQPQIKVVAHKKVYADTQDAANKLNGDSKAQISLADKVVTVRAGSDRVSSNLEIYLPRKAALDLTARHGDVTVRGREGDVKVDAQHGDVSLADVTGNALVTLRHGDISANQITGDLSVSGRVNDSTVSQIGGSASFSGDYFGDMHVSKVAKFVRFNSSRTDLEFQKLDGDFTMSSGDLRASSFAGPFRLSTSSKDIHLEDFAGDVRIDNRNGEITIQPGKLPLGNIEITNQRQRIYVELPAKSGFQLDAQAQRGEVTNDFGVNVNTGDHNRSSSASATVGGGGPRIKLNNDRGDIEIHKAG